MTRGYTRRVVYRAIAAGVVLAAVAMLLARTPYGTATRVKLLGGKTVADRIAAIQASRGGRVIPEWTGDTVQSEIALIGIKDARTLELWIDGACIKTYPMTATSGTLGPKLKEGDLQIPEGIYAIDVLNPNSSFYLSLRVNYPNAYDRQRAQAEDRTDLGGDIYIHGRNASIGCIAIGDPAIEEVFWLVAQYGKEKTRVVIAPSDFRTQPMTPPVPGYDDLYAAIDAALKEYMHHKPPL